MAKPDLLADAVVFAAVAARGSFTAASRELGLSKSAVSARVRRLEASLETRLLVRSTRAVRTTEEGALLATRVELMREHWRDARALLDARRAEPAGVLRVTAPADFASAVVAPVLAEMLAEAPNLVVDLVPDDRTLDLLRHNIDVAIRVSRPEGSSLIVRRLGEETGWVAVGRGSPWAHLHDLPETEQLRSLPDLPWVGSRDDGPVVTLTARDGGGRQSFTPQYRAWVPRGLGLAPLVANGVGAAVLPDSMMLGDPRLVPLAPSHRGGAWSLWMVRPSREHTPARVVELVRRLVARMQEPIYTA